MRQVIGFSAKSEIALEYRGGEGFWCVRCMLPDPEREQGELDAWLGRPAEAKSHLEEHKRAGHRGADEALMRLAREVA